MGNSSSSSDGQLLFRRLWSVLFVLIGILFVYQISTGIKIESDILKLLPSDEQDQVVESAVRRLNDNVGSKTVYIISSRDYEQARSAADLFQQRLVDTGLFKSVSYYVDSIQQRQLFEDYFQHRHMLISEKQQQYLHFDNFDGLKKSAMAQLYSPISTPFVALVGKDPLLLFADVISDMLAVASNGFAVRDGVLSKFESQTHHLLISAVMDKSPFSSDVQSQYGDFFRENVVSLTSQYPGIEIISSGLIYHATAGANSAKQQISTIGMGSVLGIVVLLIVVFRSLMPLLLCVLPICAGIISAVAVSVLVYGEVHLFTLIFGASLVGVSIDYAFHYLAEQYDCHGSWNAQDGLRRIMPGISLGLVTSLLGYVCLFVADFPGLQQIALFSSVGLLASYCAVVAWFPVLLRGARKPSPSFVKAVAEKAVKRWASTPRVKAISAVAVIAILSSVVAGFGLTTDDDIRILQSSPEVLLAQDKKIREITLQAGGNQFFLVIDSSPEKVLQKEEALAVELNKLLAVGDITAHRSISQQFPSLEKQQKNYQLLKRMVDTHNNEIQQYGDVVGLEPDDITTYTQLFAAEQGTPLVFEQVLERGAVGPLSFLWLGDINGAYVSTVLLSGVRDSQSLLQLSEKMAGVRYVDSVNNVSSLLARYRVVANYLVAFAYLLIFGFLLYRYNALKAVMIMLPPLTAGLIALCVTSMLSVPLNVFNTLALLLVLGVGIDYTLFFAEASSHRSTTMLAVFLSAATTILSFGLLALSETTVIHSFGLTLWVGISVAFLLSPLVISGSSIKMQAENGHEVK